MRWSDVHGDGTHLIYLLYIIYVVENISVFIFYYIHNNVHYFLILERDTIKLRACNLRALKS